MNHMLKCNTFAIINQFMKYFRQLRFNKEHFNFFTGNKVFEFLMSLRFVQLFLNGVLNCSYCRVV